MRNAYVYKNQKKLRCGYTTGSCAAGAAKAAVQMLLTKEIPESVTIVLPDGDLLELLVEAAQLTEAGARCGIRKDGGDDVDATDGIMILAEAVKTATQDVTITGGKGIGRITRRGLEQPVGSYAINSVPRRMIQEAARAAADELGYEGGLGIRISAPEGELLAKKTFNPALGIEGGISILGTSGIVEPMSEKALLDTIALEMRMHSVQGERFCILTPGNYGMHFISKELALDLTKTVKCSNFIGDTIDMAAACHMEGVLLVGHLGKFVKLGAGIMNTHSRCGDGRMEVLCTCALEAGGDRALLQRIMECITTDEAIELMQQAALEKPVMEILMRRIDLHLKKRVMEGIQIGAVVFSNRYGLLGMTRDAGALISCIRKEEER